jgi:cytochrome c2
MLNTVVRFDVPEPEDREARADYWLVWRRHGRRVRMPVPQPPFHHPDELLPEDWPASVTELPPGDAAHGGALFADTYGCASCHGLPAAPGSDTVGPHLAAIARDGATREAGKSTAQYVYESILAPNAFIAPTCPGGERCPAPSTMPDYAALLRKQDMADLIAYLAGAS